MNENETETFGFHGMETKMKQNKFSGVQKKIDSSKTGIKWKYFV